MNKLTRSGPASVTKADLNRLLGYYDWQFVDLAYQLILGREVDETGLADNLVALRAGESRREIAFRLASSEEAQSNGFDLKLFGRYASWRRIERVPFVGALLLLVIAACRVRHVIREFRRMQNAAFGGYARDRGSRP